LTFIVFAVRGPGRWWLLARVNAACLVGLFLTVVRVSSAIDYQDSRNSGVLAGFVISLTIGMFVLGIADLAAMAFIWMNRRKGNASNAAR